MNKAQTIILTAIITVFVLIVGYLALQQMPKQALGSAPTGYLAANGSSSLVTLPSHSVLEIFATSTCVSRIISHASTSLRYTLVDSATNPSGTNGNHHSASTSVSYDSGIYGCGLWRAFNPSDTQVTLTITEFRGFR